MDKKSRTQVGLWLLAGALIVYVQMILGGITRLTGSGLSITEWNVIMGVLPPFNQQQWQAAFDHYKQFPQYKLLNADMDLSGFKSIFFWEYIHRLWARVVLGAVFVIGFAYFYFKKKLTPHLIKNLVVVVLLGGVEGAMGWIMVRSGLVDIPWVQPIDLTAHLLIALLIFSYLLWIALIQLVPDNAGTDNKRPKKFALLLIALIALQIGFGGLMAGTHAALSYPTWPAFNGLWVPESLSNGKPFLSKLINDTGMIQFVHRNLAYLIGVLIVYFFIRYRKNQPSILRRAINLWPLTILLQITLGVLTLLFTIGKIPVALGVIHQGVGWLTMANSIVVYFLIVKDKPASA